MKNKKKKKEERIDLFSVLVNDRPYKGVLDCIVRVYREEGMRTFYKGLGASFVGVVETAIQVCFLEF